jgi:hypothetical protein
VDERRRFISETHDLYLSEGREIDKERVFNNQPRTTFVSSIRPSAAYFFKEMMSFLGILSRGFKGRDKA